MKIVIFAVLLFLLGYYHGQLEEPMQLAALKLPVSYQGTNTSLAEGAL